MLIPPRGTGHSITRTSTRQSLVQAEVTGEA